MNAAPEQLYNYEVMTTDGNKIGAVDNVWVDDDTGRLEFVGVKTALLFGKIHIIPMTDAEIGDGIVTVPYTQDQVKNAPTFGQDDDVSATHENVIYSYYGLGRETEDSRTGLGDDTASQSDADAGGASGITFSAEELRTHKREIEAGRVRLRKLTRIEHQEVPVELHREQVTIERVDASQTSAPTNAVQEQEIEVPLVREDSRARTNAYGSSESATEEPHG